MVEEREKSDSSWFERAQRDTLGSVVTLGSIFCALSIAGVIYTLAVSGTISWLLVVVSFLCAFVAWIGYRIGGRFLDTINEDGHFPEERGPWRWF